MLLSLSQRASIAAISNNIVVKKDSDDSRETGAMEGDDEKRRRVAQLFTRRGEPLGADQRSSTSLLEPSSD